MLTILTIANGQPIVPPPLPVPPPSLPPFGTPVVPLPPISLSETPPPPPGMTKERIKKEYAQLEIEKKQVLKIIQQKTREINNAKKKVRDAGNPVSRWWNRRDFQEAIDELDIQTNKYNEIEKHQADLRHWGEKYNLFPPVVPPVASNDDESENPPYPFYTPQPLAPPNYPPGLPPAYNTVPIIPPPAPVSIPKAGVIEKTPKPAKETAIKR